jgi:hypothetical protein
MNRAYRTESSLRHEATDGARPRYTDAALTPAVVVIEDANGLTLYADLPSVPRDKLHLNAK